jgi:hypothetical protein
MQVILFYRLCAIRGTINTAYRARVIPAVEMAMRAGAGDGGKGVKITPVPIPIPSWAYNKMGLTPVKDAHQGTVEPPQLCLARSRGHGPAIVP